MSEKAVLQALQKRVIAAIAASSTPTLPVKYVNRNFTPPNSGGWLEVIYIPNNVLNEFWGEGRTYQGVLRLLLHWKMDDTGAYNALDIIEHLSDYFSKGTKMQDTDETVTVIVSDVPNLLGAIEEPPEMLLPLSIRYRCFKA